jgi:hypothetical protein
VNRSESHQIAPNRSKKFCYEKESLAPPTKIYGARHVADLSEKRMLLNTDESKPVSN